MRRTIHFWWGNSRALARQVMIPSSREASKHLRILTKFYNIVICLARSWFTTNSGMSVTYTTTMANCPYQTSGVERHWETLLSWQTIVSWRLSTMVRVVSKQSLVGLTWYGVNMDIFSCPLNLYSFQKDNIVRPMDSTYWTVVSSACFLISFRKWTSEEPYRPYH